MKIYDRALMRNVSYRPIADIVLLKLPIYDRWEK